MSELLIEDAPTRALIQRTVIEIATALGEHESASAFDDADHALVRSYLAADGTLADRDDVAGRKLAAAIKRFGGAPALGLFGGGARIGWTIAHLTSADVAAAKCERLDAMLAHALAGWIGEYDLCSGLVGFGVYALERGEAGRPLAQRVLEALERTATVHGAGVAWHTAPELLPTHHIGAAPDGYWNLGMARGMPGVIALLGRFVAAGIDAAHSRTLLDGAVRYLLAAEPAPASAQHGRFPPWQPRSKPASSRLAWCYGDLGVAAALLGAGLHADHPAWCEEGLALAHACASRTLDQAAIHDASLCHGAAGIAHLFHRMARATGDDTLASAARAWTVETLRMRTDAPIAGYPRVYEESAGLHTEPEASLLYGAAGVALALHATISEIDPAWDRLLLVDLPRR